MSPDLNPDLIFNQKPDKAILLSQNKNWNLYSRSLDTFYFMPVFNPGD